MQIGMLPSGAKGFDCNTPVSMEDARKFYNAGYFFAVRYVKRLNDNNYDITTPEIFNILLGGLSLMLVQHVAPEGWIPSKQLGFAYGATAAKEAKRVGMPKGTTLWCDLEGVKHGVPSNDVIEFCNAWYSSVLPFGFEPGLYVGFDPGLNATQLYKNLYFKRYWGAYNLNTDLIPITRGLQMKQGAYPSPANRVSGIHFEYDTNIIKTDLLGDRPTLLIP